MKQLWARLLIVGFGEVDDGAFPSLAVAATELMFEDSWNDRANASKEAHEALDHALEVKTFRRQFERSCKEIRDATDRFGDAIEPFG